MSENENQPPAPSKQTSSVPLKKETVRVTLKAADAPPSVPSATVPVRPPVPTAPPTATVGGAPKPPAPAPTIPLRTAGAPAAAPAPTIRLATSSAPVGAPTVALKTGGGAPTMALPKATVQLQPPTQPIGSQASSQASTAQFDDEDEDTEPAAGLMNGLAIAGFVAALAVLAIQLKVSSIWINAEDNPSTSGWAQLIE